MTGINRNIGKRLSAFLLIRSDLVDRNFIPVMPSAGFALKLIPEKDLYLKSNLSRNYNVPSLNDLYWIPGGNPNLKPEESYTADLAIDLQTRNDLMLIQSAVTGYISHISNWIIWKPTQYQFWAPENIMLVFSRGVEFSFKSITDFHSAKIIVQANYNLSHTTNESPVSEVDESRGKQLIYIPKHAFNLYTGIHYKGFQMNYSTGYTGKRYTHTDNEEDYFESILEPYFLCDISISKEIKMRKAVARFQFAVCNLFDKDYQVIMARPMPGRNYSCIIEFSL
jgi:iron complex outermembrane receptor protein